MRGLILVLMIALASTNLYGDDKKKKTDADLYEQLDLLMNIFQKVREEYVDEVDDTEVIEAAIQGMLRSLDPHSTYMNPEFFERSRVQVEGSYGGLGMEVMSDRGVVKVVSPIDDTPAERAGIKGGDYITHIDGVAVLGGSVDDAIAKMRGPAGEAVDLTVVRDGEDDPLEISIVRAIIKLKSVRSRVEGDTIGYIRVTTFNMNSGEGVERAISELQSELGDSMEGVILDLRNNPGGLLEEAIRISDAFLEKGEIVSTRGRRSYNNSRSYAKAGDLIDGLPIVVLVNGYSASAREIVAGALQDHRRAIVLGDQTFGKGTVQSEMRLGRTGERAIRLTTAKYFTPSGRSIQGRGIEPDIHVTFGRADGKKVNRRREADLRYSIENDQDAINMADEQDSADVDDVILLKSGEETPDIQLEKAVALLKDLGRLPEAQVAQLAESK